MGWLTGLFGGAAKVAEVWKKAENLTAEGALNSVKTGNSLLLAQAAQNSKYALPVISIVAVCYPILGGTVAAFVELMRNGFDASILIWQSGITAYPEGMDEFVIMGLGTVAFGKHVADKYQGGIKRAVVSMRDNLSSKPQAEVVQLTQHPVTALAWPSIRKHEGFRSQPYLCTAGYPTVGVGVKITKNNMSQEDFDKWSATSGAWCFTDEALVEMSMSYVDQERVGLEKFNWYKELSNKRKAICVELAFWLGGHRFVNEWPATINAIETKDWQAVKENLLDSTIGRGEQGEGVKKRMVELSGLF